jgi:hypothetical protein
MGLTAILMNWWYAGKELFRRHFLREVPDERVGGVFYYISGSSQPLDFQSFQSIIRRYLRFSYRYKMPSLKPNALAVGSRSRSPCRVNSRGSNALSDRDSCAETLTVSSFCENDDSDAGWGCMYRCMQSLLAHALTLEYSAADSIKSDYTRTHLQGNAPGDEVQPRANLCMHAALARKFRDSGDDNAPYSLHAMLKTSQENAGQALMPDVRKWIGPAAAAHLMKALVLRERRLRLTRSECPLVKGTVTRDALENDLSSHLIVVVATDMTVCTQSVELECQRQAKMSKLAETESKDCARESGSEWAGPLLLLVPLQLGMNASANAEYFPLLQKALCGQNCIGLLGGRPGHALYIVGCAAAQSPPKVQDISRLECDTHTCLAAKRGEQPREEPRADASSACASVDCLLIGLDPHLPLACSSYSDYYPPHSQTDLDCFCCASGSSTATCASLSSRLYHELHGTDMELLRMSEMDPSMVLAFYFPSRGSFVSWATAEANANAKILSQNQHALAESAAPVNMLITPSSHLQLFDINFEGTSRFYIPSSSSEAAASGTSEQRHSPHVDRLEAAMTGSGSRNQAKIVKQRDCDKDAIPDHDHDHDHDDDDDDDDDDFVLI